jgi:hypothetical protein
MLEGFMRNRKLAVFIILASVLFMVVATGLHYLLLLPTGTATLVGSCAHWKAEDSTEIILLNDSWHATSLDKLKVWWTGTPDGPSAVRCEIISPTGRGAVSAKGPFNPWVMDNAGFFSTGRDINSGMSLIITWNGKTETLHLQKQ